MPALHTLALHMYAKCAVVLTNMALMEQLKVSSSATDNQVCDSNRPTINNQGLTVLTDTTMFKVWQGICT